MTSPAPIDRAQLRPGRKVHVRGTVIENPSKEPHGLVFVTVGRSFRANAWLSPDDITFIEPEPIEPGDIVAVGEDLPGEGVILDLHYDAAWIKHENVGYLTRQISSLRFIRKGERT